MYFFDSDPVSECHRFFTSISFTNGPHNTPTKFCSISMITWALILVGVYVMFSSHIVKLLFKTPSCDVSLWLGRSLTAPCLVFFINLNPCSDIGSFSLQLFKFNADYSSLPYWFWILVSSICNRISGSINTCFSHLQIWLDASSMSWFLGRITHVAMSFMPLIRLFSFESSSNGIASVLNRLSLLKLFLSLSFL